MTISVKREDITVEEHRSEIQSLTSAFARNEFTEWVASLDGDNSAGFRTLMLRSGKTYDEALGALTSAIEEMGWTID